MTQKRPTPKSTSRLSQSTDNQTPKRLTIAAVTRELRAIGVTIRHHNGEYRVNLVGGVEGSAYYTDDLQDALNTGRDFAKRGAVVHTDPAKQRRPQPTNVDTCPSAV